MTEPTKPMGSKLPTRTVKPGAKMTFNVYQKKAIETAVYPVTSGLTYPALGLAGEAGEVAQVVKRSIRDDGGRITETSKQKLLDELGDCLWYISALAHDANISLQDVANYNLEKLAARKAKKTLHGEGGDR